MTDKIIIAGLNPVEGKAVSVPSHDAINEKIRLGADEAEAVKKESPSYDIKTAPPLSDGEDHFKDDGSADVIIITGADAATHLLPLRDDGEPALTFRSLFLATCLSAFQAVMSQIYSVSSLWTYSTLALQRKLICVQFKPTNVTISGTFIVLIAYFVGKAWATFLPRGDRFEARWRRQGGQGKPPRWIRLVSLVNYGPWNLKEHAVCSITATSASNAAASITVFTAQNLFYDLPLSATTVILSTISIGLFGYGLCGILRPIAVWHVDSVYWSTLPTIKTLQGLHWQDLKNSKPLRVFWYSYVGMSVYEFFPAYIFPWLNSVSIPCLAAMKTTGDKAAILTNLFGGATNNEGLGLFSLSFDWQYVRSYF